MGNVWFTGDLHFNHPKVAEIRGFDSTSSHDSTVLRNLRKCLRSTDDLWVLGDLTCGSDTSWYESLRDVGQLVAHLHLILGNHDRAFPGNRNGHNHLGTYNTLFDSVTSSASVNYQGQTFLVSHFPYQGDSQAASRCDQWRLRDMGVPIIHGHTHSNLKFTLSDLSTPQLHASLDAWDLKPVSIADLLKVLRAGQ